MRGCCFKASVFAFSEIPKVSKALFRWKCHEQIKKSRASLKGGAVKGGTAQSTMRVQAVLVPNGKSGNENNLVGKSLYDKLGRCYLTRLALIKNSEHFHYQVRPKRRHALKPTTVMIFLSRSERLPGKPACSIPTKRPTAKLWCLI